MEKGNKDLNIENAKKVAIQKGYLSSIQGQHISLIQEKHKSQYISILVLILVSIALGLMVALSWMEL